jgi:hypothetical protein
VTAAGGSYRGTRHGRLRLARSLRAELSWQRLATFWELLAVSTVLAAVVVGLAAAAFSQW